MYYAPPAPAYAPPPPMYQPPAPMYHQPGPTIITVGGNNNNSNGSPCPFCGSETPQIPRKKVGCVAVAWGCCLLWTTGFLCWLPCVMDGCKDTQLICVKCQQVKMTIDANCC